MNSNCQTCAGAIEQYDTDLSYPEFPYCIISVAELPIVISAEELPVIKGIRSQHAVRNGLPFESDANLQCEAYDNVNKALGSLHSLSSKPKKIIGDDIVV